MRILVLVFLLSLARAVIISRTLSMLAKCLATKLHPSSKLLSSSWTPPEPLSQTPGLLDTVFQVVLIGTKSDSVSPLVTSIFSSVGAVLKFEVALVSYHLTFLLTEFSPFHHCTLCHAFPGVFQTNPKGFVKTFRTVPSRDGSPLLTTSSVTNTKLQPLFSHGAPRDLKVGTMCPLP